MKTILKLASLIILSFMLFSCSGDDDSDYPVKVEKYELKDYNISYIYKRTSGTVDIYSVKLDGVLYNNTYDNAVLTVRLEFETYFVEYTGLNVDAKNNIVISQESERNFAYDILNKKLEKIVITKQ